MKTRSAKPGTASLPPEVTHVSQRGLCLLLDGREHFLDFDRFPWFREAPVRALFNISRPDTDHLCWPELDVDIDLDSLAHPERYPLVGRILPGAFRETARPARTATVRSAPGKAARPATNRPKR